MSTIFTSNEIIVLTTRNGAVYCPGVSVSFAGVLNLLGHASIKDPNGEEIVNTWLLGSSSFPACPSGAGTYTYTQNLVWPGCYVCNENCPTPTHTPTTTQNQTSTPTPTHTPIHAPTAGNQTNVPVADFTGAPRSGAAPLNVSFTDTFIDLPTAGHWYISDGKLHFFTASPFSCATATNASARYRACLFVIP